VGEIARSPPIAYTFAVDVTQCASRIPPANHWQNLAPAGFFVFWGFAGKCDQRRRFLRVAIKRLPRAVGCACMNPAI